LRPSAKPFERRSEIARTIPSRCFFSVPPKVMRGLRRLRCAHLLKQGEIDQAHRDYLELAESYLVRGRATRLTVLMKPETGLLEPLDTFIGHAERQIDQIRRRVLLGETIPHEEKVFSLFQPHTEWISKGKASVHVELGMRVCVVEDQFQFIISH